MQFVTIIIQYLLSIAALSLIVIVHELGHFSMARLSGVRVEEFFIGFGPKLFKVKDRRGTTFGISAIPFGGYNKLLGMDRNERIPSGMENKSFHNKPAYKKLLISIGGTGFNIIFAVLLIWIFLCFAAPTTTIGYVEPGSAADEADFKLEDRFVSMEGHKIEKWEDFVLLTENNPGEEVNYIIERNGEEAEIKVKLTDKDGEGYLGVAPSQYFNPGYAIKNYGFFGLIKESFTMTWDITITYVKAFGMLFSGEIPISEARPVSPVGILNMFRQTASMGMQDFIFFIALISILIGYGNMIPILPLDGGNILFIIIESIRKRPVPQKVIEYFNYAGVFILVSLMLIAVVLDIINPFSFVNL
ncbi:MAG: M50 family metallopeptidase [Actinomycetota bacterium]|nr:M50 family metallopeptidase [Actinomycetota bacterium]